MSFYPAEDARGRKILPYSTQIAAFGRFSTVEIQLHLPNLLSKYRIF